MTPQSSPSNQPHAWPDLVHEVRRHSPEWAERLAAAATPQELASMAAHFLRDFPLFQRLTTLFQQLDHSQLETSHLAFKIHHFLITNLHRGLTLKELSTFLGYSAKYCSEFFHTQMGEPFSHCVKRLRVDKARHMLRHSQTSHAEIAAALGFSDQFAFSHFFKKAAGCSPSEYREQRHPAPSRKVGETKGSGVFSDCAAR